jgi:D-alanyl-D-alanine carboxypeptidase
MTFRNINKSPACILIMSLIAILVISGSCSDKSSGPDSPQNLNDAELTNVLDDYITDSAGVLGIMQKIYIDGYDSWSGAGGYFDISKTKELDGSELFAIGSITKTFTATIIMQLYEENEIILDSPIVHYLSSAYQDVMAEIPNANNATVYQALCHRTGIYDYTRNWDNFILPSFENPAKSWTPMERLLIVRDYGTPDFTPGESFAYSSTNYLLLGVIIENIEQQSYADVLRERVAVKIGLTETFYHAGVIGDNYENFAHGYDDEFGHKYDICEFNLTSGYAEGGIISSTHDLVSFFNALVNDQLFDNSTTFELMLDEGDIYSYGFGLNVVEHPVLGKCYEHGGSHVGQKSMVRYYPVVGLIIASCLTLDGSVESNNASSIVDLMENKLIELGIL